MTTIRAAMTAKALAEFDQMVAAREAETRFAMKAAGCSRDEIESHVAECRARVANERALIPGNVSIALMRQGVDLTEDANVWE